MFLLTVISATLSISTTAFGQGWQLTWKDEFSGPAGGAVDPTKWSLVSYAPDLFSQELQFYTSGQTNASTDGAGNLVITALDSAGLPPLQLCWYGLCRYSSALIQTYGLFSQMYGRFEARLKIPFGQGLWPAFWLLGDDYYVNGQGTGWPESGEIDIMENIGREPRTVHGTLHGPITSTQDYAIAGIYELPTGNLSDAYHKYAIEWEPNVVRFYFDGNLYKTATPADVPPGGEWVFDHPFFIRLNVAVGGNFPGPPDVTTTFPQKLFVDYVRVYKRP